MIDPVRSVRDRMTPTRRHILVCLVVAVLAPAIVLAAKAVTATFTPAAATVEPLRVAVGFLPDGTPDPLAEYLAQLPQEAQINGTPLGDDVMGADLSEIAYVDPTRNPESIPAYLPPVEASPPAPAPFSNDGPPLTYVPPVFPPGFQGLAPTTPGDALPTRPLPPYDPTGLSTDKQAVVAYIAATFPEDQVENAIAIAKCESGIRSVISKPNRNGSRDWGVYQLNDAGTLQGLLRVMGEDTKNLQLSLDAEWNVRAAYRLYQARGWQPWACAAKLGIIDGLWSYKPGPAARR